MSYIIQYNRVAWIKIENKTYTNVCQEHIMKL